jgi:predicted TIM-barrel fold metal-dependent hydrolase
MYAGPILDTYMHLWDLADGYAWLSHRVPAFEHLIGNYAPLRSRMRWRWPGMFPRRRWRIRRNPSSR